MAMDEKQSSKKNKVAMKFFENTEALQDKITEMVKTLKPEKVKSITGHQLYKNIFYEYF